MYGNQPECWSASLRGVERWRCITNYLTRMRRCSSAGRLEFDEAAAQRHSLDPATGCAGWFVHPARKTQQRAIVFGHWAALNGEHGGEHHFPLDTGYVWGGRLRLMNLADRSYVHLAHD
jgi:bis(5'-nucleosyl)-tetraphosphatase (symmetrical)